MQYANYRCQLKNSVNKVFSSSLDTTGTVIWSDNIFVMILIDNDHKSLAKITWDDVMDLWTEESDEATQG